MYQIGVSIQKNSLKLIQEWKRKLHQKHMKHKQNVHRIKYVRRIIISFCVIKIRAGSLFYVNSGVTLKILNAALNWTMNALLVFYAL